MKLKSGVRWLSMSYKSVTSKGCADLHDMFLEPSLHVKYTFSGTSELSLSSATDNSVGDILDLVTEDVQTDYRSTRVASGIIAKKNIWTTLLAYKYEIPFWFFCLNTSASWTQGRRNILTSQYVDGGEISNSSVFGNSHIRKANVRLGVSKNVIDWHMKLSMEGTYSWNSSEMLEQGRRITAFGSGYTLRTAASVTPWKWIELNYHVDFNKSFTRYAGQHNRNESLSHAGRISVFPTSQLELMGSCDNLHQQIAEGRFKNFTLFDAAAQLKVKHSVLKLSLQNILNTRHYSWTVLDGVNTFSYDYSLCGRTLMLTLTYIK